MRLTVVAVAVLALAGTAVAKPKHKAKPDLRVTKVTTATSARPGQYFTLSAKVKNAGKRKVTKKTFTAFYLEMPDDTLTEVARVLTRKFDAGQTRTVIGLGKADVPDGTYRLKACADVTKLVKEAKDGNNCRFAKGSVTFQTYSVR